MDDRITRPGKRGGGAGQSLALLDFLRVFAAWSVIAWHLGDHVGHRMPLFASAAFAVDLFMILSGFLMLYHYREREGREPWSRPRTWLRFYIRRVFRIMPLFLAVVGATVWLFSWLGGQGLDTPWERVVYAARRVTFAFAFMPSQMEHAVAPEWSLGLEMQFYLLFPFLALLLRRIGYGLFFFLCTLGAAVLTHLVTYYAVTPPGPWGHLPQPTLLPLKLHVFAVGMVAAGVYLEGPRVLRSWWYLPALVCLIAASRYHYTQVMDVLYVLLAIGFLLPGTSGRLLGLFGAADRLVARLRVFHLPAELSYSAYLIHPFVFFFWLGDFTLHPIYPGEGLFLAYFVAVVAVLLLVGGVLYAGIERPGIALGRRILKSMAQREIAPKTPS